MGRQGLQNPGGNPTSSPFRNGPYKWDQHVTFTSGLSGTHVGVKGVIYYVDEENGNDANNGLTPGTAFASILTATALARDDYSDDAEYHIFIAPGSYDETDSLRLYGHGIHLHGMGIPGVDSGVNITDTNLTNSPILLAGANCTIENIQFLLTDVDVAYGALCCIAADNCLINNCKFKNVSATTDYCITIDDMRCSTICNCRIGDMSASAFKFGIYGNSGADKWLTDTLIQNNMINGGTEADAVGIFTHSNMGVHGTVIDQNWINLSKCTGSAIGIDINSTSRCPLITNNYVTMAASDVPIECAASPTGILHNATQAGGTEVDPNTAAG